MKKLLIAAGAGALLVVAQAAVSAAYNPLDRVDATAKGDVAAAPVAPTAKSVNRPATTFDAAYTPLDMASGNPVFGSDELTAGAPRREIPVTDRLSGETGRYNLALDAVSEQETCAKRFGPGGDKGKVAPVDSFLAKIKCERVERPYPLPPEVAVPGLTILAVTGVVASDSGKSD
ncbi:MAG: hypothetical protein ACK4FG_06095 [Brevundimonas sp.]